MKTAIVIGAGIVGLAMTRALSEKGYQVKVFDRSFRASGASVRNFGMIWPIGQPGKLYERAIRSREIWKEAGDSGAFWYEPSGSLHLAYNTEEWQVLQELYESFKHSRPVSLLTPGQVLNSSQAVVEDGLLGALHSTDELIVDPREAISSLPGWLTEKYNTEFYWNKCVSYVADNTAYIGNDEEHEADIIVVCSGADFETLYPEAYSGFPLIKCKLQMLRFRSQPDAWRIGPALCGGLSLIHYKSFQQAASIQLLKEKYQQELPEYLEWGIHVMVSQNGYGELTVGDSHEYGTAADPFNKGFINTMIIDYLKTFARFKDWTISETWNGVYSKLTDGDADLFFSPEPGVFVVNGLGGAGMTLSFGLAEEVTKAL